MSPDGAHAPARVKFDVESARREFPILEERIHDRPLVYLDNANTTQKPKQVLERLDEFYRHQNANIHRATHQLSERATAAYEGARAKIARFIGARETGEIVLTKGCTDSLNLVAQSFARPRLKPGDEILVTWLEHHSNIVPWQLVAQVTGAKLHVVPIDESGDLSIEDFEKHLTGRTKIVSVTHISNALGTILPVREIVELAHDRGVPVIVDGAQSAAHMPVDVQAIGCDFFAFSSHKMYGPTGSGALYGKRRWLDEMPPCQGGGDMISTVSFEESTWAPVPHKFEAGTPNIAGVVGFGAAVDFLRRYDLAEIAAHEHDLLEYGTERLAEIPGLRIIGTAARKSGVLSFVMEGIHPHDVGTVLDQAGVAIRTGQHCAQPVMDRYGIPATARISFGLYNTRADIDAAIPPLHDVRKLFG
jgi:cysteine desulfurase / selenocysteine lyase